MSFEWKHFEMLMKVFNFPEFHFVPCFSSKMFIAFDLNLQKKTTLFVWFWIF